MGTITVKVSEYEIIRYCNLSDIQVWYNTEVETSDYLGVADEKKGLQLEYCTKAPETSNFVFRVNDQTYYKQNPLNILNGLQEPYTTTEVTEAYCTSSDTVQFTNEQIAEWGIPDQYIEDPEKTITADDLDDLPQVTRYMLTGNKGDD